jgi:hypothetical protein
VTARRRIATNIRALLIAAETNQAEAADAMGVSKAREVWVTLRVTLSADRAIAEGNRAEPVPTPGTTRQKTCVQPR